VPPILELRSVSKHFVAIHALNEVDLTLDEGEVLGLMGDNGAGKSTLVKVIFGNFPPTLGKIHLAGEPVRFHRPVEAREKGIEVVYHDLALCNNLSAAANVFLGREVKRRIGPFRLLDHKAMARHAGALFTELKSETRPRDLVRQMSGEQRQAGRHRAHAPLQGARRELTGSREASWRLPFVLAPGRLRRGRSVIS
jgi:simple sugar transport system ATP-binding protein